MKTKRHLKIIELIKEKDIETQEDLAHYLKEAGFEVTQATISRDIRELKLTKVSTDNGKQKYEIFLYDDEQVYKKMINVFKEGVININFAQNIIVIKTLIGMAMAVAAAIDSMEEIEILGSIAGDDTIFCVVTDEKEARELVEKLNGIINA